MKFFTGILFGFFLTGLIVAGYLASGSYDVSAAKRPSKMEARLAAFALNKSVAKRAPKEKNPVPGSAQIWAATLPEYRENCVTCHGAPGVDASEIGEGLNPPPPDLTLPRVQARPDGELFWIVSNGIRTTGMPAFGPTHKPEEIWKLVALLRHLPELSAEEQKALKGPAEGAEDHHH
jgi:mono/diheme cytochrome c family protein